MANKLDYQTALNKTKQMITNQNLFRHCLAVGHTMRYFAKNIYNLPEQEQEKWAIAGILHDADWEKYPDQHPNVIVQWLKEINADPNIINAVASHGPELGVEPKTQMARVLRAIDEITGFIVAVALVKGRDLNAVTVKSIAKKWKDKGFARGVHRDMVQQSAQEAGFELTQLFEHVLTAMQEIKDELGL